MPTNQKRVLTRFKLSRTDGSSGARIGTCAVALWAAAALGVLPSTTGAAQDDTGAAIENTRAVLEQYVETERVIAREKRNFELGREMLNERISLVEDEIAALREKIREADQNIAEADDNRTELVRQNEQLKDASDALMEVVIPLEGGLRALLKGLPSPIRDRVKPLSQRIPDPDTETKVTLSERYQNVIGILNEIDKFNRDIHVTSEVRDLPDGTTAEVTALYLGIGQSYYTGSNGTIAGVGTSSPEGWEWKPANDFAQRVAQVVAILKNEQVASFVQLPISIDQPAEDSL